VTLLKPVCGLEKNLRENLRTACSQDYPIYQVVYSVQYLDDAAIPLLWEIEKEFGSERVTVAIENVRLGLNGKVNNLAGGLRHARHDVLVISDSDVCLRPDYLRTIVAPLADPEVGAVSTFYKATGADRWYEQMELLTLNADHFALAQFAYVVNLFTFCFGPSIALRREMLAEIGGLEALGDYLVEDYEMGRRILRARKKMAVVNYVVDTMVDLRSPAHWWQKMTDWDQKSRAARPGVFAATIILRVIPLGLLFAAVRGFDPVGMAVLGAAFAVRLAAATAAAGIALRDRETVCSLWLIPVKDTLSLFWYVRSHFRRSVVWRGVEMGLTSNGRLVPLRPERPAAEHTA
jgi:ceramide glucosyltransferase